MLFLRACEALTELIIYGMVIFGPWAFGSTQSWSVRVGNCMGFALGLLWVGSKIGCRLIGHRPPTWDKAQDPFCEKASTLTGCRAPITLKPVPGRAGRLPRTGPVYRPGERWARHSTVLLAVLTVILLGFCLISALNPRATYLPMAERFEYHDCIGWLPHSFDSTGNWHAFWSYLGLACWFWAVRDWVLGLTTREQMTGQRFPRDPMDFVLPARLSRLLWVLSLNGAALGLEAIVQRLANCPRLLFLVQPAIHSNAQSQFGPFAYRANAAAYFNLLWPICLGFWWTIRARAPYRRRHSLLAICAVVMAACPIISTSRGGALVAFGLLVASALVLLGRSPVDTRPGGIDRRSAIPAQLVFFVGAPALGLLLGWQALKPRLAALNQGFRDREKICALAERIAQDYRLYGTGPGTYEAVSTLYRPKGEDFWPAQVHNDWLETRITFGLTGCALLVMAGLLVLFRCFLPGGLLVGDCLVRSIWVAFGGLLIHARFDFPFQVHSVLSLFVVLSALLFSIRYQRSRT